MAPSRATGKSTPQEDPALTSSTHLEPHFDTAEHHSGALPAFLLVVTTLMHFAGLDLMYRVKHSKTLFGVCLGATLCSALYGVVMVPVLRYLKFGQVVRENGPEAHLGKQGTPTMGGLYMIPVGVVGAVVATGGDLRAFALAAGTLAFAAIGLWDDSRIIISNSSAGLSATEKLIAQVACGSLFVAACAHYNLLPAKGTVWITKAIKLTLAPPAYAALSVFSFVALSNGVNLTDGLDGLAAGTSALAFLGMTAILYSVNFKMASCAAALSGCCLGFLTHNRHPALVFMGDTGSLGLGAALAGLGVMTGQFGPLVLCTCVFAIESISVIAQITFFKVTKRLFGRGTRLFTMAPIHHHFELTGTHEAQVTTRFYLVGLLATYAAVYSGLL